MEKHTDRILWSVLILAIGVSLFVIGKPAYSSIIKNSTQQLSHSTKQWSGASFLNDQFASGNTNVKHSGAFVYDPVFDTSSPNGLQSVSPFKLSISNGVYRLTSDASAPSTSQYGGFYLQYGNDNNGDTSGTFDTGDTLTATVKVKGIAHLRSFGFESSYTDPTVNSQFINTHGKWQTLTFSGKSRASASCRYSGLSFYVYYYPNTDISVKDLYVPIN